MPVIEVTTAPVRLVTALGYSGRVLTERRGYILGAWDCENAGPSPVFMRRATTAPDPADDIGMRLTRYQRRKIREFAELSDGYWWLWTTAGKARLVVERGSVDFG